MSSYVHPDLGLLGVAPIPARAPYRETLSWLTDILPSYNGQEERIRVRNKPRQRLTADFYAQSTTAQDIFNTVYGGMARRWAVPVWSEARQAGTVLELSTTVNVDTRFADFRPGSPVLLIGTCGKWGVYLVDALDDTSLTLSSEVVETIRGAVAVPVRIGRVAGSGQKDTNGYGAEWRLTHEIDDNLELDPPAPTQYYGDDIYLEPGLFEGASISQSVTTQLEKFDYDTGLVNAFTPWTNNRVIRPYRVITTTDEEAWNLRLWLHRRAGRYRAFWQPSFENDVRKAQTGALTNTVTVYGDNRVPWASGRVNLAFGLKNGTWLPRRVIGDALASLSTRTLTLDNPLNVNAADVIAISYLGLKRLEGDSVDLNWIGNGVCQMSVPVLELTP